MKSSYKASLMNKGALKSQTETISNNDTIVTLSRTVYDDCATITTNSITILDILSNTQCYMRSEELSILLKAIEKSRDNGFSIESIANYITAGLGDNNNE